MQERKGEGKTGGACAGYRKLRPAGELSGRERYNKKKKREYAPLLFIRLETGAGE